MSRILRAAAVAAMTLGVVATLAPGANATPVCTDGYMGGPPRAACGLRVFPEATNSVDYVQYTPQRGTGFREFQHGIEYLAQLYPRWISVFNLADYYEDEDAVSAGPDDQISYWPTDTGDGYDIWVIKLTDHQVPDEGKQTMLFSLSVHGDEIGGREGAFRAVEDLAMAAESGGEIADGVEGYESTTGVEPEIHSYPVEDILAEQAVYFIDFNIDGWVVGETNNFGPGGSFVPLYSRGNYRGTDLNRQMPTVGWINSSRNPLEESEMLYGNRFMHDVAEQGVNGLMAYAADVHGESQSRAWVDIMYPAGQFNSIKHRQLMAIAERTKSVIDDTLFLGLVNLGEEATGGDAGEGLEDSTPVPDNTVMTKPARWGTVWDTLGYTDTGFIGDYMANELGVTGMDYEIALNHSDTRAYGRPWSVVLQENYINATRGIVKTAMAYAMYQDEEFAGFEIDPGGRVGYVFNPTPVTDTDENGPGRLPGPGGNGVGANGKPVEQRPYSASPMQWFEDTAPFVKGGMATILPFEIVEEPSRIDAVDTIIIADEIAPADPEGRVYDRAAYVSTLQAWVERGGNLVLTDSAIHLLAEFGVVPASSIRNIGTYMPYANFPDHSHPMLAGLRGNARQLAEYTLLGFPEDENRNDRSPMTIVTTSAWTAAGGTVVGTTGNGQGSSDSGTQVSVGEIPVGNGQVRITNGLETPTEAFDHRYGLKNYALTYSGLFILENSLVHDAEGLGETDPEPPGGESGLVPFLGLFPLAALLRASSSPRWSRMRRTPSRA